MDCITNAGSGGHLFHTFSLNRNTRRGTQHSSFNNAIPTSNAGPSSSYASGPGNVSIGIPGLTKPFKVKGQSKPTLDVASWNSFPNGGHKIMKQGETAQVIFEGVGKAWEREQMRVRTGQACEGCRQRKTKCSGDRPVCMRCAYKDVKCIWSDSPSRTRTRRIKASLKDPSSSSESISSSPEPKFEEKPIAYRYGMPTVLLPIDPRAENGTSMNAPLIESPPPSSSSSKPGTPRLSKTKLEKRTRDGGRISLVKLEPRSTISRVSKNRHSPPSGRVMNREAIPSGQKGKGRQDTASLPGEETTMKMKRWSMPSYGVGFQDTSTNPAMEYPIWHGAQSAPEHTTTLPIPPYIPTSPKGKEKEKEIEAPTPLYPYQTLLYSQAFPVDMRMYEWDQQHFDPTIPSAPSNQPSTNASMLAYMNSSEIDGQWSEWNNHPPEYNDYNPLQNDRAQQENAEWLQFLNIGEFEHTAA